MTLEQSRVTLAMLTPISQISKHKLGWSHLQTLLVLQWCIYIDWFLTTGFIKFPVCAHVEQL